MKIRILLSICLLLASSSWAGSQKSEKAVIAPERIFKFAKEVEKYAASQRARAFIIARLGRPEGDLPEGIRYTHTAIAVYSNIQLADGETVQGYAIHNLYQINGETDKSHLVIDYPADFFWGVQTLKAGIIIPNDYIQERLVGLITKGLDVDLHNSNYSVIANPFSSEFQNCTEYTLDMLNAAIYQTTDIETLKANERAYFTAQKVDVSPIKLTFGSWFMDDVTTQDHQGDIKTATFTSIYQYLRQYGLAKQGIRIEEGKEPTYL